MVLFKSFNCFTELYVAETLLSCMMNSFVLIVYHIICNVGGMNVVLREEYKQRHGDNAEIINNDYNPNYYLPLASTLFPFNHGATKNNKLYSSIGDFLI